MAFWDRDDSNALLFVERSQLTFAPPVIAGEAAQSHMQAKRHLHLFPRRGAEGAEFLCFMRRLIIIRNCFHVPGTFEVPGTFVPHYLLGGRSHE